MKRCYKRFVVVRPRFADVFEWREALEGLRSACVIVSRDDVRDVRFELGMRVVVVAFCRCVFDDPVHPLNLPIGPGVVAFGAALINFISRHTRLKMCFIAGELEAAALGLEPMVHQWLLR